MMLRKKKHITVQCNKTKMYLNEDFCVPAILFIFSKQHSIEKSYSWGSDSKEFLLLTSQVLRFYFIARNKVTKSPNQLASTNNLLWCVKDCKQHYFSSKTFCPVEPNKIKVPEYFYLSIKPIVTFWEN